MNRSTRDLPVHHQLLEFTKTHVHWVGNAIQPYHPLFCICLLHLITSSFTSKFQHVLILTLNFASCISERRINSSKYYCHHLHQQFISIQLLGRVWLFDPVDCSMPGLPVHHQLPEFTQTHVHYVSDAIQPSHPLSSPSPSLPILPRIRIFSNESTFNMR